MLAPLARRSLERYLEVTADPPTPVFIDREPIGTLAVTIDEDEITPSLPPGVFFRVVSDAQYKTWLAAAGTDLPGANKALMAEVDGKDKVAAAGN